MSNVTVEYLGYVAPEYAHIDAERFNALRDIASEFVNEKVFGEKAKYATALYIAHILKVGERQGISGSVISERVGDISRSYSDPNSNASYGKSGLEDTSYGKQFVAVRRSVLKTPII